MKITNYFFFIKLNIILIIIIGIECMRLSSESYLKEKSTLKNKAQEHSTANLQTNTEKTETNLSESSKLNLSKKNLSQLSLTTKNCNPLCSQCSTNDLNYCTLCRTGMIFHNYNCFVNCPEGTFLNQQTRSCQLCHNDCPICWGPEKDMCGNTFGSRTQVVSLENEIIEYFNTHVFIKDEVDYWINSLKIMFLKDQSEIIYPLFTTDNPQFSVYLDEKTLTEIPIGSFSFKGGLLIPVPPYIDRTKRLIEFHWTYKKGMWDGTSWHSEYFPRLPTFIKYKGSTNKIYQEDNGFWYYDAARQWVYVLSKNIIQEQIPVIEKMTALNKIKIDIGNYNLNILKLEMENKKLEIENYIRKFFDDFSQIDSNVFADLKKSIQENEASMIYHMELIKNNVSNYFNEAPPEKDKSSIKKEYEEKKAIMEKSRPRPINLTKQQFDEMDKSSNGFFSLQMERVNTLNKFYGELNSIQ